MLRSLYSGISGLRANQTMMDVVGNNIANVNTVGFKSSNAMPAAITTNFNAGSTQTTGRSTDVMIQGDGFLIEVLQDQSTVYTRNGSLNLDASGYLTGPDGGIVQGYMADPTTGVIDRTATAPLKINMSAIIPAKPTADADGPAYAEGRIQGFSIGKDGILTGAFSNGQTRSLGQLALATFINAPGLSKAGQSGYVATINSGQADIGVAADGPRGSFASGFLEMSNVDLANEFTSLIVAQRGFQANSRIITASDEVLQDLLAMKR